MAGLWIAHELKVTDPLIDVRQVRNRSVLTADVSAFLIAVAMYLFLPIVLEFVQIPVASGYGHGASILVSGLVSGLVFVPLSIGSFVASRCLIAYTNRFGVRTMIPFGSLVFAVSALFFALQWALWEAFVAAGIAGIGIGFTFAAMYRRWREAQIRRFGAAGTQPARQAARSTLARSTPPPHPR
jgi:MFS family permease